jgi:hypothetical protein
VELKNKSGVGVGVGFLKIGVELCGVRQYIGGVRVGVGFGKNKRSWSGT